MMMVVLIVGVLTVGLFLFVLNFRMKDASAMNLLDSAGILQAGASLGEAVQDLDLWFWNPKAQVVDFDQLRYKPRYQSDFSNDIVGNPAYFYLPGNIAHINNDR